MVNFAHGGAQVAQGCARWASAQVWLLFMLIGLQRSAGSGAADQAHAGQMLQALLVLQRVAQVALGHARVLAHQASARAPSRRSMASSTCRCWSCATMSMSRACGELALHHHEAVGRGEGQAGHALELRAP
jgi:hypothetical protein